MVENQQSKKIQVLRTDSGCEYCSNEFENYLKSEGIVHQKMNLYTSEQNGLAERSNRTIVEKARCLLFDAELKKELWVKAANKAVYLKKQICGIRLRENSIRGLVRKEARFKTYSSLWQSCHGTCT